MWECQVIRVNSFKMLVDNFQIALLSIYFKIKLKTCIGDSKVLLA